MSEDEIIERVSKFINITVLYGKTYGMTCDDLKKYQQVFRGLLDLYQKEKDSNQWLLKAFDESRNNNIELSKEYCKIQQELQQEKENNKFLKQRNKALSNNMLSLACNSISKDKIISKIKELEEEQKEYKGSQEWEIQDNIDAQINILKKILEED